MIIDKQIKKELLAEIILFFAALIKVPLLYKHNLWLTATFIFGSTFIFMYWHKKEDFYFYGIGAILVPLLEIVCVYFGVWNYRYPSFLGIPSWLPFLWGILALALRRTAHTLVKMKIIPSGIKKSKR